LRNRYGIERVSVRVVLTTVVAALILTASACSGGRNSHSGSSTLHSGASTPHSAGPTMVATPSPVAPGKASGSDSTIEIRQSPIGAYLTDGAGRALYLNTADVHGKGLCSAVCAIIWPAVVTKDQPHAGSGVNGVLLGTIKRSDGTAQITYKGQPLYRSARDVNAGDAKSQGLGKRWYLVSPTGSPIIGNVATSPLPTG
jgi:predicted lipoprotein with Yx(FWY)xxD motif